MIFRRNFQWLAAYSNLKPGRIFHATKQDRLSIQMLATCLAPAIASSWDCAAWGSFFWTFSWFCRSLNRRFSCFSDSFFLFTVPSSFFFWFGEDFGDDKTHHLMEWKIYDLRLPIRWSLCAWCLDQSCLLEIMNKQDPHKTRDVWWIWLNYWSIWGMSCYLEHLVFLGGAGSFYTVIRGKGRVVR